MCSTTAIHVRQIRAGEAPQYRDLRLAALLDTPTAYAETYAEAIGRAPEAWRQRVAEGAAGNRSCIAVAERGGALVGMAAGYLAEPRRAEFVSLWLAPHARGSGAAQRLVEHVVAWARGVGCSSIALWVTEENTVARHLYERCHFAPTGERQPLPSAAHLQEERMSRALA